MIIRYLNVIGIAIAKPKANPPLIVNGNRILPSPVPLQLMEPIARRNFQVSQARREIKILQLPQSPLPDPRRELLRPAALVQLLRTLVSKGLNHARSVMWCVTPVNTVKSEWANGRKAVYAPSHIKKDARYIFSSLVLPRFGRPEKIAVVIQNGRQHVQKTSMSPSASCACASRLSLVNQNPIAIRVADDGKAADVGIRDAPCEWHIHGLKLDQLFIEVLHLKRHTSAVG